MRDYKVGGLLRVIRAVMSLHQELTDKILPILLIHFYLRQYHFIKSQVQTINYYKLTYLLNICLENIVHLL